MERRSTDWLQQDLSILAACEFHEVVGRRIVSQKWIRTIRGSGQGKWLRKRYTYIYIYIYVCTTKVDKDPRNPATDSDI